MKNKGISMDKVIIFDTTLRDGEQAAGGMLNHPGKAGDSQATGEAWC